MRKALVLTPQSQDWRPVELYRRLPSSESQYAPNCLLEVLLPLKRVVLSKGTFVDPDLNQTLVEEGFNLYPSVYLVPSIFVVQSRRMIPITVSVVQSR